MASIFLKFRIVETTFVSLFGIRKVFAEIISSTGIKGSFSYLSEQENNKNIEKERTINRIFFITSVLSQFTVSIDAVHGKHRNTGLHL